MPTYKNDTARKITHPDMGYMEWKPGETKRLPFFVPHENLGLTLVDDEPLDTDSVYGDWTIALPSGGEAAVSLKYMEAYELSVYATGGNDEPVAINEKEWHVSAYTYARCPSLRFTSTSGATVRIKQEEKNTKNALHRGGI